MTVPASPLTSAAALVAELRSRGIYVLRRGPDRLRIGPPEMLDEDIVAAVRAAKPEILAFLGDGRAWPCARCGRFRFHEPAVCYWCRRVPEALA